MTRRQNIGCASISITLTISDNYMAADDGSLMKVLVDFIPAHIRGMGDNFRYVAMARDRRGIGGYFFI